jgi:hypothetical protein
MESGLVRMHPWVWINYQLLAPAYWRASDTLVRGEPRAVGLPEGQYLVW